MYPGQSGSFIEGTNSIVWRTERFDVLQTKTVGTSTSAGTRCRCPTCSSKEKASGRKIWFANFHNPADVHGAAGHWRAKAIAIEADLATALGADGTPVIMTGDFNDRSEFFCPFTSQAPFMTSASGATGGPPCNVPRGASVDWLLGLFDGELRAVPGDRRRRGRPDHRPPAIRSRATGGEQREHVRTCSG